MVKRKRRNYTPKERACRKKSMKKEMGAFKRGKLKDQSGKKITERRRAIAVALRTTAEKCHKKKKK